MKTLMFVAAITLVCGLCCGQTGLFYISFGDSIHAVDSALAKQGFGQVEFYDYLHVYSDPDNPYVEEVGVYTEADSTVAGWYARFRLLEDEKVESMVIGALISWHSEDFSRGEDDSFRWKLTDDRAVNAEYSEDGSSFVVSYWLLERDLIIEKRCSR